MNEKIETTFGGTRDEMTMLANVFAHYLHAKEKHPYFTDVLIGREETPEWAAELLEIARRHIKMFSDCNCLRHSDLLKCEYAEAVAEIAKGDYASAIDELYDCVAVCLRTIDVLEGRQALGKPEEVKE